MTDGAAQSFFTIDQGQDRILYRLPFRDLAGSRHYAWSFVVTAVFMILFIAFWLSVFLVPGFGGPANAGQAGWGQLAFAVIPIAIAIPAIAMLVAGLAILFDRTHCTLELNRTQLITREKFFFITLKRKADVNSVKRLYVTTEDDGTINSNMTGPVDLKSWIGNLHATLAAEDADGAKLMLVFGYPREQLIQLSHDLAPRLDSQSLLPSPRVDRRQSNRLDGRTPFGDIEVVDHDSLKSFQQNAPSQVREQPTAGQSTISRRDDGITIHVPAQGLMSADAKSRFFGAMVWIAICGYMQFQVFRDNPAEMVQILFALAIFMLAGVGGLLHAFHIARTVTTIATADDRLLIKSSSPLHSSVKEWRKADIFEINVKQSDLDSEVKQQNELQVHAIAQKKHGCLSRLDDTELLWIVSELQAAMGLSPNHSNGYSCRDAQGRPIPTSKSRLTVHYHRDESTTVEIPRPNKGADLTMMLISVLLILIGAGVFIVVIVLRQVRAPQIVGFISLWSLGFTTAGVVAAIYYLILCKRTYRIDIDGKRLLVNQTGLTADSQWIFQRDQLNPATVVYNSNSHNRIGQDTVELSSQDGKSANIMRGYPRDDLELVQAIVNESRADARSNVV